jgi:hypothetical protein
MSENQIRAALRLEKKRVLEDMASARRTIREAQQKLDRLEERLHEIENGEAVLDG